MKSKYMGWIVFGFLMLCFVLAGISVPYWESAWEILASFIIMAVSLHLSMVKVPYWFDESSKHGRSK